STTIVGPTTFPAGIAGNPINLGLSDPTADVAEITLQISGMAAGWTLSEGAQNADGSWTVQTSALSALTVKPDTNFVGATVLQGTETWTNADATTGNVLINLNVEAYAPGSPIFALSGEDHLSGGGGNDTFVFAQPIGQDTIDYFYTTSDRIDLIDFASA